MPLDCTYEECVMNRQRAASGEIAVHLFSIYMASDLMVLVCHCWTEVERS